MSRYDFTAPRLFIDAPLAADANIPLERDQANYLLNVLRLGKGGRILVFNGRDGEWLASLRASSRKAASLSIVEMSRAQGPGCDLHFLFAPLKHARLDYMIQKAVEMGASCLMPVITRRTQVARVNLERMRANAIEAAEQCGILNIPDIAEPQQLDCLLASWPAGRRLIFCDEDEAVADPVAALRAAIPEPNAKLALIIGPEGGFDDGERDLIRRLAGAVPLSLGPRILRADTAAVAALAVVQAAIGDWLG